MRFFSLALFALSFFTSAIVADVLHVPSQYGSINDAVDAASEGDTVLVANGTYNESITFDSKSITLASWFLTTGDESHITGTKLDFGSSSAGITIESGNNPGLKIVGLYCIGAVDGMLISGEVELRNNIIEGAKDGIDFEFGCIAKVIDNTFVNNLDDGLDIDGMGDFEIRGNTIRNNNGDGIEIRMLPARSSSYVDMIIDGNYIFENNQDGIQIIDGTSFGLPSTERVFHITNNVIYDNGFAALGLMDGSSKEDFSAAPIRERIRVINNTMKGNLYGVTGGGNMILVNNIIVDHQETGLLGMTDQSIGAFNLFHNNGTDYSGSIIDAATTLHTDPLLDANFKLTSSSPAIDQGTASFSHMGENVLTIPSSKYNGLAPDLGAHEFEGVSTAPPPPPSLVLPVNEDTKVGVTPEFQWSSPASTFDFEIASDEGFSDIIYQQSALGSSSLTLGAGILAEDVIYFWRVNASDANGTSQWSSIWQFNTGEELEPLEGPELISPVDNAENVGPEPLLSWSPVVGADTYEIEIAEDSNFDAVKVDESFLTSSSFQVPGSNLPESGLFFWRVRAHNALEAGPWSSIWQFNTGEELDPLEAPELTSPADDSDMVGTGPLFSWGSVSGAHTYEIEVAEDSNFDVLKVDESSLTSPSFQVPGSSLPENGLLFWRVRAHNDLETGPWSSVWSFYPGPEPVAPGTAELLSPLDKAVEVTTTPVLSWHETSMATEYRLQLSTNSDFKDVLLDEKGVQTLSFEIEKDLLEAREVYFWRVQASNDIGKGSWSNSWSFNTGLPIQLPSIPDLISPGDEIKNASLSTEFFWSGDGITYQLQLSLNQSFSDLIHDEENIKKESFNLLLELEYETEYFWRVRAFNDDGESDWSSFFSFMTVSRSVPLAPVLSSPVDEASKISQTPTLEWSSLENKFEIEVSRSQSFGSSVVLESSETTDYQIPSAKLINGKTYFWRVKAVGEVEESPWSEVFSFVVDEKISGLVINEFAAHNVGPTADPDENGIDPKFDDWIELYNSTTEIIDVGGLLLCDEEGLPIVEMSLIPQGFESLTLIGPGEFLLLWADRQPIQGPLHLNFSLEKAGEEVLLLQEYDGALRVLDHIQFGRQFSHKSYGRIPDGSRNIQILNNPTPFTSNKKNTTNPSFGRVYINEVMSQNSAFVADEAGEYDDWIEIYNDNDFPVDLGGFFLTDDLDSLINHEIPFTNSDSTTIPAKGFLRFWADGTPEQGIMHLNFKLSGGGEFVALTDSNQLDVIDWIKFGNLTDDLSYGPFQDGTGIQQIFNFPTPLKPNKLSDSCLLAVEALIFSPPTGQSLTNGIIYAKVQNAALDYKESWSDENGSKVDPSAVGPGTYFLQVSDNIGCIAQDTLVLDAPSVLNRIEKLYINEVMPSNGSIYPDPDSDDPADPEFNDWIEIYNGGSETIELAGLYFTDDPTLPLGQMFKVPVSDTVDTQLLPGEFKLIHADKDLHQGPLHANFKLSKRGEHVAIYQIFEGEVLLLDDMNFQEVVKDISYGRFEDFVGEERPMIYPTPLDFNLDNVFNNPPEFDSHNQLFTFDEFSQNHLLGSSAATDPDGDSILYQIIDSWPSESFEIDPQGNIYTNDKIINSEQSIDPFIVVEARDNFLYPGISSDTIWLKINSINSAPVITGLSDLELNEDFELHELTYSISDEDGDDLEFTLDLASEVFEAVQNENSITFHSKPDRFGQTYITYTLSDGMHWITDSISVNVSPVNDIPKVGLSVATISFNQDELSQKTINILEEEQPFGEDGETYRFSLQVDEPLNDFMTIVLDSVENTISFEKNDSADSQNYSLQLNIVDTNDSLSRKSIPISIEILQVLGIGDDLDLQPIVYPNPSATGIFKVRLPDSKLPVTAISVYDSKGRLVLKEDSGQVSELDLSKQASGQYIMMINSGSAVYFRSIILR